MIIVDDDLTWTAIGQPAHAWLAAQLAAEWSTPVSRSALLAIEQHDVAWSVSDRLPQLEPARGRAASFTEVSREYRLGIWSSPSRHLLTQDPYAALLVSMHATNIFTRYGPPGARPLDLLAQLAADQEQLLDLLAGAGVSRPAAERDADRVFAFDAMSLALCLGRDDAEVTLDGQCLAMHRDEASGRVVVAPWPFGSEAVTVGLLAQRFTDRFDDEVTLRRAVSSAPWQRLDWHLVPG